MKRLRLSVLIMLVGFAALSLLAPQAQAQEELNNVNVELRLLPEVDIEDFGAEVGLTQLNLSASYLCFTFDYGLKSYRWSGVEGLPFGNRVVDPWDNLHKLIFGLRYAGPINDEGWSYFVLGRLLSGFEEEMNSSFGYNIIGGVMAVFPPQWELRFGVLVFYDEVDEFGAFPVGTLLWNQEAATGWSAILGLPKTNLRYKFTPEVSAKLVLSFDNDLYRLANDSSVEEKGYFKDEALVLGLHLDIATSENSFLDIGGQYSFNREFSIYNQQGSDKSSHDIDGAFGLAVKLCYNF
jgi:hypothetical protein